MGRGYLGTLAFAAVGTVESVEPPSILADIMSGGAVVLAYACYRFFPGKVQEERAYYDWVGYVFLFVTVCALLPMPFAGIG